MTDDSSVTQLIARLKQGDPDAAGQLWERYFERLVSAARRKLDGERRRAYDEEDVALSVFNSLCRAAERGNLSRLTDRSGLWALLLEMTRHKVVDRIRHEQREKRGGGKVRGESVFANAGDGPAAMGINQVVGAAPTPDDLIELQEQHERLMAALPDDDMRRVALLRMEGHSIKEIAKACGFTTHWVDRKLKLIRKCWSKELSSGEKKNDRK